MKSESVAVAFFLNGERYAVRLWAHVPRVGDEIMLGSGRKSKGKVPFVVRRAVWGVEAATDSYQAVNLEIAEPRND